MTLTVHAPITLDDITTILASHALGGRRLWMMIQYQRQRGVCVAVRDGEGRALAIGGFWPSPGLRECWAVIAPEAADRMRELVSAAGLTLASLPQDDPRPVVAVVRSRAGARIARLLGFTDCGEGVWRYDGSDLRPQQRAEARDAVAGNRRHGTARHGDAPGRRKPDAGCAPAA